MSSSPSDLPTVDLSECENEPIHLLEMVQAHGCIIVAAGAPLTIRQISANADVILGGTVEDLLDAPLSRVFDGPVLAELEALRDAAARQDMPSTGAYARPDLGGAGVERVRVSAHRLAHAGETVLVIDLEPVDEKDEEAAELSFESEEIAVAGMQERENLYQFLDQAVHAIAGLTDYDRVMAYMFHPDWSGEVVAEARHPDLTPFLGLRYPASDIPSQARRLYLTNRLRVIADVNSEPVPMMRAASAGDDPPLDLSGSVLRSVSSYHIEYLRNMGVGATLVTSLILDGDLWGLIACHHSSPKAPPWHQRETVDRLTARIAQRIGEIASLQADRQQRRARRFQDMMQDRMAAAESSLDIMFFGAPRLSDVIRCDGVAVVVPGRVAASGNTPPPQDLPRILERLQTLADADGIVASHNLSKTDLFDERDLTGCRGALVAFASTDPLIAVACFRDELVREVHWGGDPNKPVEVDSVSQRVSPRKSFNLWREEVRGQSRPWEPWCLDLMRHVADMLIDGADADADPVATMGAAIDDVVSRFESRAESMLESLDLADNGAMLAAPSAAEGGADAAIVTNQAFRIRFDVDESDVIGRPVKSVLRALGLPGTIAQLPPGGTMEVEWWSGEAGHRTLQVLRRGLFAVCRPDDRRAWAIYTFDDVTNYYRTQRALGAAHAQAVSRARGRAEFLGQLARELREPLNAIQGFADALDQDPGESSRTDRYRDYAGQIRSLSGDLLDLLNEVLDITRLERGDSARGAPFDLTLMVGEVCQSLRESRHGLQTVWDWHLPNERILVQGDERALRQALQTLIAAALRASPATGRVMVRLTMERGGEPRVSVIDTGLGLSEDDLMALRRPLDSTLSRVSGTVSQQRGLGLALARGLVDLHGGTITVSSNPGSGTTVNLSLPRHRVVARDNAPTSTGKPARPSGPRSPTG